MKRLWRYLRGLDIYDERTGLITVTIGGDTGEFARALARFREQLEGDIRITSGYRSGPHPIQRAASYHYPCQVFGCRRPTKDGLCPEHGGER